MEWERIFKCQRVTVSEAIVRGFYGQWMPNASEQAVLERIFPTGVCDYTLRDLGRPPEL